MDSEIEKTMSSLPSKAYHSFSEFMTRVAKFDELTNVGNQLLRIFQQKLELYTRPPLKITKLVEGLIEANKTERMMTCVEAGFRNAYADFKNTSRLHPCRAELRGHIKEVKMLIDELEILVKDAVCIVEEAFEVSSQFFDEYTFEGVEDQQDDREDTDTSGNKLLDKTNLSIQQVLTYTSMMSNIWNMLKLDYSMQEKIVMSLDLNTSSGKVETYCLMWKLRPYINAKIMTRCWEFIQQ